MHFILKEENWSNDLVTPATMDPSATDPTLLIFYDDANANDSIAYSNTVDTQNKAAALRGTLSTLTPTPVSTR